MMQEQINYIKKYLDTDHQDISKNEKLISNLLFYKNQYEKQKELENDKNIQFKSDAKLFGIKEDITKPIYKHLNCGPKAEIEYPENKKFVVVLTHDVDLVFPSWKYRYYISAKLALKLKFKRSWNILTKKENPYWTFKKIITLEGKYNAKSSFYFLTSDRDIRSVNYQIKDLSEEIQYILDKGWEVGLHGGYYSYNSLEEIKKEKEILEKDLGKKVIGYRNHCLRFNIPNTWRILKELGFKYDTTFGYNDMIGFRNGLCFPFKPYDMENDKEINILEISLNIMDETLFRYMNLDLNKAWECCKKSIDIAMKYGGVFTVNWHNNGFDGIYWENYEKLYEMILKYCYEKNAWMTNGENVWKWWNKYTW